MKYSFYNSIIIVNEKKYLYNSFSGALIGLDDKTSEKLRNADTNEKFDESCFLDDELYTLKKCSVIVPDELNEIEKYLELKKAKIENDKIFRLTIAPTLNCNFRCHYCFEEHQNKKMSAEVQDTLCKWIKQELTDNNYSALSVTWFGGEPLMCTDTIIDLSARFLRICDQLRINYFSSIITNGYLLNSIDAKDFIAKCKINTMQITIDGTEEIHNKRRILYKSNIGTYNEIIKGINSISSCDCKIKIRINLDKANNHIIKETCNQLKENIVDKHNVYPYLAKLFCMDDLNAGLEDKLLHNEEYIQAAIGFSNFAKEAGFNVSEKVFIPKLKIWFCPAPYGHSKVIDPDGYIYYCWNDIGIKEYSAGSIFMEENEEFKKQAALWKKYAYEFHEDCIKCKSFVTCAGGCAREKVRADKNYSCDDYSICSDMLVKNYIASIEP